MGQSHVTTILQNAVKSGRIAHAYLFCGPRGCGKTSSARLLARALNCLATETPTAEPCGVCELCIRIRDGNALDVIEMDAASETGIDDVREKIIENAKYAPAEARYKVYIIDEVHDLSAKAFDSLLKTIEEPPAHVVFVLATTEMQKVPITIRSRCQRLDFRRGATADLTRNLKRVLEAEGVTYEPGAVSALARAADGSYRDSLSLVEQVMAYSESGVTESAVYEALGAPGPETLEELVDVLASDDMARAFKIANVLADSGKEVRQVLSSLQQYLRDLLVVSVTGGTAAHSDIAPERIEPLQAQSAKFTPASIIQILEVLAAAERETRFTNLHRLVLERALLQALPSALAAHGQRSELRSANAAGRKGARSDSLPAAQGALSPRLEHSVLNELDLGESAVVPNRGGTRTPADAQPRITEGEPAVTHRGEIDLTGLRRVWPKVVKSIAQRSPTATAILVDVTVAALDGNVVELQFPNEFNRTRAMAPRAKDAIEKALQEQIGAQGLTVRCAVAASGNSKPPTPAIQTAGELLTGDEGSLTMAKTKPPKSGNAGMSVDDAGPEQQAVGSQADNEILHKVVELFDGKLMDE